jgi:acetyltransferase-like isoleucine patch superfamily enzyme
MRERAVACYFVLAWLLRQPVYWLRRCNVAMSSRVERGCVLVASRVGAYCYIGGGVHLNSTEIGNYCSIAAGTKIGGMEHAWWWGSTSPRIGTHQHLDGQRTTLGDDVWIGANVVVRQGVQIGSGAVVGAGSVVLRNVDPYTVVAGVPARPIRRRFSESVMQAVISTQFWLQPPARARDLLAQIDYDRAPQRGNV